MKLYTAQQLENRNDNHLRTHRSQQACSDRRRNQTNRLRAGTVRLDPAARKTKRQHEGH